MLLHNEHLTVEIDALGGELRSIRTPDGTEYLWQGHPDFWKSRAINIFPFVARLWGGKYRYRGRTYALGNHGFVRHTVLDELPESGTAGRMVMEDNADTRAVYPFRFRYEIEYRLEGPSLHVSYRVTNQDKKPMYFGIGGHPGFNVPLEAGRDFSDYRVRFPEAEAPERVLFSPSCFLTGEKSPYELGAEKAIGLYHRLFDTDVILLEHSGTRAILEPKDGQGRAVELQYPGCRYLGVWHSVKTDAPFICLEPWAALPGRDGVTEDLESCPNVLSLDPGETYVNRLCITIR